MWMRSLELKHESELRKILSDDYGSRIEKANKKLWDNLDNPDILLTLFDGYNDGNASKRIINELQR